MRDGLSVKMGVPNGTAEGGHRPSRLEMMREDYQKKILREKEQKMVQLYEDSQVNQKKTMMRIMRGGSGEGNNIIRTGPGNSPTTGPSVRDFFNERRRLESSGAPVPPIDDHYRKAKGYSSPGGWSSRTNSATSAKKLSAGRDRSNPLAPIRRIADTREAARTGNTPRVEKNGGLVYNENNPNPFNARPKMVKHKPLPYSNVNGDNGQNQYQNQHNQQHQTNNHTDRNNNDKTMQHQTRFGYQAQKNNPQQRQQHLQQQQQQQQQQHQQQQQQQQQRQSLPPQRPSPKRVNNTKYRPNGVQPQPPAPHPPPQQRQNRNITKPNSNQQPKLTDFQKWQLEQNHAREERLRKLNSQKPPTRREEGYWDDDDDEDRGDNDEEEEEQDYPVSGVNSGKSLTKANSAYNGEGEEENEDDDGDDNNNEVARLERELMEKIEREKLELDKLRHERTMAEEDEKREIEENKKREKAEKARQKKLEEQRRKEEEQRRREEEEDERRERQREEKERKEEEKRRREEDKRRKEDEKLAAKREKEEQKQQVKQQQKQAKESARSDYNQPSSGYEDYDETPIQSSRRSPAYDKTVPSTMEEIDEQPVIANKDSSYYAKIAKSSEAKGSVGSLAKCRNCGRSFAEDRLRKHMDACQKASKPRKEFDSSKKRIEGTDAAKYAGKTKKEPSKKKNNWRAKHEEFINSLRYAKKAAQYEAEGKDLRQLTPPPTQENPDLVPCPYCNRTFNVTAAERHIPRCKDLKTKPPPVNTRRR